MNVNGVKKFVFLTIITLIPLAVSMFFQDAQASTCDGEITYDYAENTYFCVDSTDGKFKQTHDPYIMYYPSNDDLAQNSGKKDGKVQYYGFKNSK